MNLITRECQDCPDLQELLSDIDCTILDLSKNKYNSVIYGVENCFNSSLYHALIAYKRIITGRLYNSKYPCSQYTSNELLSKVRLLAYKTGCTRCPECEEVITTTTTLPPPPGGDCMTYLVEPKNAYQINAPVPHPYSYIDCSGGLVTGVLTQYQVLNVCAIQNTIVINPNIFTVTQYATGCSIVPEDCICTLLFNVETDPGVTPYEFSYEDCNGNTFTDVPLLQQNSVNICVRRSTLVTNFAYTLSNTTGTCIEDCP